MVDTCPLLRIAIPEADQPKPTHQRRSQKRWATADDGRKRPVCFGEVSLEKRTASSRPNSASREAVSAPPKAADCMSSQNFGLGWETDGEFGSVTPLSGGAVNVEHNSV